jgi:hypothetical protein
MRVLAVILLTLSLSCAAKTSVVKQQDTYMVPVETVEKSDIPLIPSHDGRDAVAVITVPSFTIVTTETGTKIQETTVKVAIYKHKKTLREYFFPKKSEAEWPVEAFSSIPNIKVETVEHGVPWWWWISGLSVVGVTAWSILSRFVSAITGPLDIIRRIIRK